MHLQSCLKDKLGLLIVAIYIQWRIQIMATVKFTEVFKQNRFTSKDDKYRMRSVYVNPDFVICLREDEQTLKMLKEDVGLLPDGLDPRHQFTKLHINGGHGSFDITVVGSPDTVEEKLKNSTSKVLKG